MSEMQMTDTEMVEQVLAHMPYAATLGVEVSAIEPTGLVCRMPHNESLIGNVQLPAIHGGALASFMEIVAIMETARRQLAHEARISENDFVAIGETLPVPVNVTVQYLRSAASLDCYARAEVLKLGRRSNTVLCRMWQADEAKPVASMTAILVRPA